METEPPTHNCQGSCTTNRRHISAFASVQYNLPSLRGNSRQSPRGLTRHRLTMCFLRLPTRAPRRRLRPIFRKEVRLSCRIMTALPPHGYRVRCTGMWAETQRTAASCLLCAATNCCGVPLKVSSLRTPSPAARVCGTTMKSKSVAAESTTNNGIAFRIVPGFLCFI